ncbi:MAG: asparagine synthase (glutamine-hydrolyzing) [Bryobacteraceae bacterium]|nr:asparagine synthase (glutamine-hydrolyzing) [Bryobacteraceae bacterium]
MRDAARSMCGICGIVDYSGAEVDSSLVSRMARTLEHRGPDGEGIYTAPSVGLGQRRLSIIDLRQSANPPLSNEDGSIWIVFNGEIYGYREERERLESRGHVFRTASDTEVIVHLYEDEGVDCLKRLRGMFAFAIWDSRRRSLFAARDRLGKKPFCYIDSGRFFAFGSEIKAITALPGVSREPDFAAIDSYLTWQYVPSPMTAFQGIRRLPAGHFLICEGDGRLTVERYWSPPARSTSRMDENEVESELIARLREAVRLRTIADVPLGAFLSGGIDSGLIVALMAEASSRPVKTFTVGFEDKRFDERYHAGLVAARYGTDHRELTIRPDAAEALPTLVRHYNEPFADSSAIPTYYLSQATRRHVTVALSGDGGDESFSGYEHYRTALRWAGADAVPQAVRRMAATAAGAAVALLPRDPLTARIGRAADMVRSSLPDRYRLQVSILKPEEKSDLYSAWFADAVRDRSPDRPTRFGWDGAEAAADWTMRFDQSFYLPDCLMVKTDIASMAHGLEVRCPLLDHRVVEFAASIPAERHRNVEGGKRILKQVARRFLPDEVLSKPKTGFSVPLARWLREDLRETVKEALLGDQAAKRGLFRPEAVRRMVDQHARGTRDWSNRMWALLFLELWFREWVA